MEKANCMCCGKEFPIEMLDAKPGPGQFTEKQLEDAAERGDDFEQLECPSCFGPGYTMGVAA